MAEKRGNNNGKNQLILLVILLIFLAVIDISTIALWKLSSPSAPSAPKEESIKVTEIISGDTIKLSDNRIVKMIGIDAPESNQIYYQESINLLKFLILDKQVRLEPDAEDKDAGGNLRRYVYVEYNGEELFVNLESVRQGYSLPFHIGGNQKYRAEIEVARQECLTNKINICG